MPDEPKYTDAEYEAAVIARFKDDDENAVDESPLVSRSGEDGAWVEVWTYISNAEVEAS